MNKEGVKSGRGFWRAPGKSAKAPSHALPGSPFGNKPERSTAASRPVKGEAAFSFGKSVETPSFSINAMRTQGVFFSLCQAATRR